MLWRNARSGGPILLSPRTGYPIMWSSHKQPSDWITCYLGDLKDWLRPWWRVTTPFIFFINQFLQQNKATNTRVSLVFIFIWFFVSVRRGCIYILKTCCCFLTRIIFAILPCIKNCCTGMLKRICTLMTKEGKRMGGGRWQAPAGGGRFLCRCPCIFWHLGDRTRP